MSLSPGTRLGPHVMPTGAGARGEVYRTPLADRLTGGPIPSDRTLAIATEFSSQNQTRPAEPSL